MKIVMLGGSKAQELGILKAKQLGHTVIVCDYLKNAVGHQIADKAEFVSTFDKEGVLAVARKYEVDGIMTMGTDQPVYTTAYVAKQMKLPQVLAEETAYAVTNKKRMKEIFEKNKIPTTKYSIYKPGREKEVKKLTKPLVMKPLDSQGQRGIHYIEEVDTKQLKSLYKDAISYSRCEEVIIEEYYEHDEITVSGWVNEGKCYILSITDRVTFDEKEQLGICLSHEFPSQHMHNYGNEIIQVTKEIVKSFAIENGPIYFQFLLGEEGIKVNEIACRIGGAFEATFLPIVTGFDITNAMIQLAVGEKLAEKEQKVLEEYKVFHNMFGVSVQLFFLKEGKVKSVPKVEEILEIEGVVEAEIFVKAGEKVTSIQNATSRGGYVVIIGKSQEEVEKVVKTVYEVLKIKDIHGENLVLHATTGRKRSHL